VNIGNIKLGSEHPIVRQTMTTSDTRDVAATVAEVRGDRSPALFWQKKNHISHQLLPPYPKFNHNASNHGASPSTTQASLKKGKRGHELSSLPPSSENAERRARLQSSLAFSLSTFRSNSALFLFSFFFLSAPPLTPFPHFPQNR
jgi:hypothetical protein